MTITVQFTYCNITLNYIIVIATSITVYWRKKKRQQYEVEGKKERNKIKYITILFIVDQQAIRHNQSHRRMRYLYLGGAHTITM